jgi:hypothetical protein
MKKIIFLAALALVSSLPIAALEGYEVETSRVEDAKKHVTIDLQYTESTRNLLVVYTVKHLPFDEGDAVALIRDTVTKFAEDHGFKHYKTYSDDIIKYHGRDTELTRFFILYN